MYIQHLLQPIEVEFMETAQCPIKAHKHSFFELVYILDGEGSYTIDNEVHKYGKDDVIVIIPERGHYTTVWSITKFMFIRFNAVYMSQQIAGNLLDKIRYLFANQKHLPKLEGEEGKFVRLICEKILSESQSKVPSGSDVTDLLVRCLLTILVRQLSDTMSRITPDAPSIENIMLDYIQSNIRNPERLRIQQIAHHVHLSENYVSEFFRRKFSLSLQDYIQEYRFKLVEERLRKTSLRIGEIAREFGFSSESHFSTAFRNHKGFSPGQFRRQSIQ